MNERKKSRENRKEKDYYFPVIVSQLVCCAVLVGLFFFARGTDAWPLLSERYSSLLQEDFITAEFSGVVSNIKEYFIEGNSSFAVNGNRVEPYSQSEISQESDTPEEAEATAEAESEAVTDSSVQGGSPAVQTISLRVNDSAVPLRLEYKKQSNMASPLTDGVYTSYFGERTDPIEGDEDYHKGIDIAADEGEPIMAVFDGVVASVGEDERSGKYVFLEHGKGVVTLYCHCSEITVKEDEKVKQGDVIALVGSTGYSTGPHLHFEVRMNGESVDPLPLLEYAD